MARYGGYETVSRVGETAWASVWTARHAGAEADELERFVVKATHRVDLAFGEGGEANVEEFLDAARVQQRVAAAKPDHWAPVHEAGSAEGEAFYVTDYCQHTADDLARVRIDARTLHTVVHSVVQALRDLQEVCQRPHGDLKGTNILISAGADAAKPRVFLADPAPAARLDPKAATGDLRNLGILIHLLAVQKAPTAGRGAQLVPAAEGWKRLGKKGQAWHDLCSRLLLSPEEADLARVAADLEKLCVAPAHPWRVPAMVGGLAAVLVLGWVGYKLLAPPPPKEPVVWNPAAWQQLCDDHYRWFAKFLNDMSPARRARWRADAPLDAVVDALDKAERRRCAFDPRDIAGKPGATLDDLRAWAPEEGKAGVYQPRVDQARECIEEIQRVLSAKHWPKLGEITKLAEAWAARGWARPAGFLQHYLAGVKLDANLAPSVERFVEFAGNPLVPTVEPVWAAVAESQKKLTASGDKVLAEFQKWAQAAARSEGSDGSQRDVEELLKSLQAARTLGDDLARVVDDMGRGKMNRELFAKEGGIQAAFDGTVMEHTFRRWLTDARDFYLVEPNARGTPQDWAKRTAKIGDDIAELEKLGDEGKEQAAKFRQALGGDVKARIAAMWKLIPIRRDEHLLKRGADQAREEVQHLESRVQGAVIFFAGSSKEWLERTQSFAFASSPILQASWDKARGALLGGVKPADLEADRDRYLKLRNQVQRLRKSLERLDDEFPRDLPAEAEKHSSRPWYGAFLKRTRERREVALRDGLQAAAGGKDMPDLDAENGRKALDTARQGLLAWRDDAAKTLAAHAAVEEALDACWLPQEKPPGAAATLGELHDQAGQAALLAAEPELRAAVAPIGQRVAGLRAIAALKDRAALAERGVGAGAREAALAAWRVLGSLADPVWPASAEELARDTQIRQRLASDLRSIADAPRREALQKELTRGGQERELRWLNAHFVALRRTLDGAGDPVLAQFGKYVDGQLGGVSQGDPAAVLAKLRAIEPVAGRLAGVVERDWPKKIARDLFAKESAIHHDAESNKALVEKGEAFDRWLAEVADYYYLDEASELPRRSRVVAEETRNLRQALADLEKQDKQAAAALLARLQADVEPVAAVPLIRKSATLLTQRVALAEKTVKELRESIGVQYELISLENEIAAKVKAVEGSQDAILARFGAFADQERKGTAAAEPAARKAKLIALRNFAGRLETIVQGDWTAGRIERQVFARESAVHKSFQADPTLRQKVLEDWLTEVQGYYVLTPDPRGKREDWDAKGKEIEGLIARLATLGGEYAKKAGEFRGALGQLASQSIEPLWATPAVRKNEDKLVALVRAASAKRDELKGQVNAAFETEPQWRARIVKLEPFAKPDVVDREWRKRRDELLKTYSPEALGANSDLYLTTRGKFDELIAFLKGFDDGKSLAGPPAEWPPAFQAEGRKARDRALEKAVAAIPWGADGFPSQTLEQFRQSRGWLDACAAHTAALAAIGRVQGDAAAMQALLDAGYLPDDKPDAAPRTARGILTEWQNQTVSQDLLLPFEPTIRRAVDLVQIQAMTRPQLAARAKQVRDTDPPQAVMLLWQGLGKAADWPAGVDELKLEGQLRQQVAAAAGKLAAKNPHPVRWVDAELAKEGPRRWDACFARLSGPEGPRDADLLEAIKLAPQFGVAPAQLPAASQFRWLLCDFRQRAFGLPQDLKVPEVATLLHGFEVQLAALPNGYGKQEGPAGLLKELRSAIERGADDTGMGGLDKGGPAAATFGITWQAVPAADGKAADYVWADWRPRRLTGTYEKLSLRFVRVEPRGGGRAVYLCTTEVSLDLFIDVVAKASKWQDVNELLGAEKLTGIDPRKGPRVWQPTRGQGAILPTREWLVALPGVALYPRDAIPPPPSRAHPMQYVSPEAALYLARLLGCRLPTTAEWAGAFDVYERGKDDPKRNLRDKAWQDQQAHAATQGGRLDWPDAGIFVAADAAAAPKARDAALPVTTASDGTLWFAPADLSSAMQALVGNVAEFVHDDAGRFEQAFKLPADLTANAMRDFTTRSAASLKVVGGSALSPPEYWDGKAQPFDRAYKLDLEQARQGYSDVGFRLAFSAPSDPPAARLARVLTERGYR